MPAINAQALREMGDEVHQTAREAVVPIGYYQPDGTEPQPIGTGTLFAVADSKFIVSAAHVIEAIDKLSGMACVFVPGEMGEYGTRLAPIHITGNALRVDDPVDVSVMALSEETGNALSGCRFLRLNEVALWPEPLGCGWVSGFPNEYIRDLAPQSRGLSPLTLGTVIRPHDGSGLQNFDPFYHFLLDADRDAFGWSDGSGPATLPDRFQGISGSAVWQTWWPSRGRADDHRSRGLRVVGVQTGYYRTQSLIKATHWGCVAEVIRYSFPELRSVLGMHLGSGFGR